MDKRRKVVLAIVLLVVSVGIAYAATNSFVLTEDVHLDAQDGPEVILGEDIEINTSQPFPDANTVRISPFGSLESDGSTTVQIENVDGQWTNLTEIDVGENDLTVDLEGKDQIRIGGEFSEFAYQEIDIEDDETTEIEYAASGESELTVFGMPEDRALAAVDSNGAALDATVVDSNGEATFFLPSGEHEVNIQETAAELEIRDEVSHELIDTDAEITVRFFQRGEDEVITRETSDGTVSLEGIPHDEELIVDARADGYHARQIIIESTFDQATIFLLDETDDSVLTEFVLDDNTNQFGPNDGTRLIVQKPIQLDGEENAIFRTIAGDEIGASGAVSIWLSQGDRYRISVQNDDGNVRTLGTYTAERESIIELEIGDITFDDFAGDEEYLWGAKYDDEGSVQFHYNDSMDLTERLSVTIHERNNETNVVYDEVHTGVYGELTITQPLDSQQQNQTWVVEWEADRDGEVIDGSRLVGKDIRETLPELDPMWQTFIAVALLIIIGGSLGAVAPGAGAISVGILGGVFYYIGWLPDAVAGIFLAVAFMAATLFTVQRGR